MADPIGSLRVLLGLDSAQFETGLKKAQTGLSGFGKNAAIAGAAVGAAMAGAAIALGGAIKGAIDRADEMSKAAQKFGVPIDELSRLQHAADLSDVSLQQLGAGLGRLSKAMADAAGGGTSSAAKALQSLGISATDASGKMRPTSEVMQDLAGKFAGMQDGAGKTALAMAVFGKSGADLIPLLNSGKDGLAEMGAEADALGLTLDENTGKAAEAFNDNLTRLQAAGKGIANQLAGQMAPALASVSGALVSAAKNTAAMDAIGKVLSGTIRVLATAAVAAGGIFIGLGAQIGGVATALGRVVKGDFAGAMQALDSGAARANAVGKQMGDSIRAIWSKANVPTAASANFIGDQLAAPIVQGGKKIKEAVDKAKPEVDKFGEELKRLQQSLETTSERGARELRENILTLNRALYEGRISAEEYNEALSRLTPTIVDASEKIEVFKDNIKPTTEAMQEIADEMRDTRTPAERMADAFADASDSVYGLFQAFKSGNFTNFARDIQAVGKALSTLVSKTASGADKFSALAGLAQGIGDAIGGRGGRALSGAASGALAGFQVGGPIGAVVGGVLGGLSQLLKGKPSNKGAGFDLVTGAVSGKSRTAETEEAARGTGQVILQMQAALKKLGATLSTTVNGLVIGTRDLTQIYLSDGRTLTSAIGDAGAATEAALHAVLQAADFADVAQKELVKSMLEAGESALDIVDALSAAADEKAAKAATAAAQRRELEIRLMEAQGDAQGALNARRADEIAALDESNRALQQQVNAAEDVASARAALNDLLSQKLTGERDELSGYADRLQSLADSLHSFGESLKAANDNGLADVAAQFRKIAAAARGGDEKALGDLQGVSEAFLDVSRSSARSDFENRKAQAQVRIAVQGAEAAALNQVGLAKLQIEKLDLQLQVLTGIQSTEIAIHQAVLGLNQALQAQAAQTAAIVAAVQANDAQRAAEAGSIDALRSDLLAIGVTLGTNTRETAAALRRWDGDGLPGERDAA